MNLKKWTTAHIRWTISL